MADAQYVIDIAASMPAGDATIAELDALTATLTGAGKNADHFQQAIKSVSASLDAAKAASNAANVALAAGNSEYASLELAALQAAKAAEKAAQKNQGVVPHELAARAAETALKVEHYASTLAGLEAKAASAAGQETKLAATFKNVSKLSSHANAAITAKAETIEKLRSGLMSVPGAAGRLGSSLLIPVQGFAKLSQEMGKTRALTLLAAVGLAALAVAVVAVGVALVAATVKVAAWAVGLADARRSAGLTTEAFNAMNPALAGLPFDAIAKETGQSSSALRGLAKQLTAAKVSAEDMPAALRAAALAEAALGQGGASDFIASIREGKTAVSDLAQETSTKLGGIVSRQMLGLDAQSTRLKKSVSDVFGGLNIDPVLAGLDRLVGLFDKNSAAGQAMAFLFEKVFQPLIDQADKAAIVIEAFVLGFLIGLTKLYIALKPAIKAVSEFFGFEDTSLTDVLALAKKAGEFVAPVFAILATIVGVTLAGAFVAIGAVIAAQLAIWYGIIKVVGFVKDAFMAVYNFLTSIDLGPIGNAIMMGLVNGIVGAMGSVISAVKTAVGAAIGAAKSVLGIASPSKVFASIGDNTGLGFAAGIEGATGAAQDAMADMVAPPDAPTLGGVAAGVSSPADAGAVAGAAPGAAGAAASTGGGGGGASFADMFRGAVFNFGEGVDGKKAADDFHERWTQLIEGMAAQLGGEAT